MTATTWADWPPREPITLTDLIAEARVLSIGILPIGGYVSGPARLEHFPSALNRRDSQPLSPRQIWGN